MSRLEPFIFEWQRYSPTTTFLIRNRRPIFFAGSQGLRIFLGMRQAWRFQWDYSRVLNRSEKKMVQGFVRWIVFSKNRLKKMVFLVLRRLRGQKTVEKTIHLRKQRPPCCCLVLRRREGYRWNLQDELIPRKICNPPYLRKRATWKKPPQIGGKKTTTDLLFQVLPKPQNLNIPGVPLGCLGVNASCSGPLFRVSSTPKDHIALTLFDKVSQRKTRTRNSKTHPVTFSYWQRWIWDGSDEVGPFAVMWPNERIIFPIARRDGDSNGTPHVLVAPNRNGWTMD